MQREDRSPSVADLRDQAADLRDQAGEQRDEAGEQRDQAGEQRDQAADLRDEAADRRDQAADLRDQAAEEPEGWRGAGITTDPMSRLARFRREAASDRRKASHDRRAAALERAQAELDRNTALADRGTGSSERAQAELDRGTALADRGASARERAYASIDSLTGVYRRGAGFAELEREMARAKRTNQPLVLAFVDVDRLKAINDSRGHAAGDRMLLEVADTLKAKLRSYDLIMRYGGDEFVCAISGLDMLVEAALAQAPEHGSVTVGLAELQADASPEDLVARADAALYRARQQQEQSRAETEVATATITLPP
jgi:GGDEF domain-containing protein